MKARLALFTILAASLLLPSDSNAGVQAHAGCFNCKYKFVWGDPFSQSAECAQVPNNNYGDEIYCRTYYTGLAVDCEATGGGCYYIEVNGSASAPRAKHRVRKPSGNAVQLF